MPTAFADRVKQASATIGTGAYTLGGAYPQFRSFSSAFELGARVDYCVTSISGGWEVGRGRLTDATTLTREEIYASSNGGSAVSWAAGAKEVFCVWSAAAASRRPERLASTLTLYVRADGSDSNSGDVDSPGGAFLTINRALQEVYKFDRTNFGAIISIGAGAYNESVLFYGAVTVGGDYDVQFIGDPADPSTVVLQSGFGVFGSNAYIAGVTFSGGLNVRRQPGIVDVEDVIFDNCGMVVRDYGYATLHNPTFQQGASSEPALWVQTGGVLKVTGEANGSVVVSGNPVEFAIAEVLSYIDAGTADMLAAWEGPRYFAEKGAIIDTGSGDPNYLPGDSAGSVATGGQYL